MSHDDAFEAVVDRVTELLGAQIGLRADSGLRGRLRRCIRDQASAYGQDVDDYLHTLTIGPGAVQALADQVTVQETGFFRHPEHFRVLARDILPQLTGPVTIWSAGCANGQEAVSLAMVLQERGIHGSVIATDLSTSAIRRTAQGYYTTREMTGLSPDRIARNVSRDSHGWRINEGLRGRITVFQHNLIDAIPQQIRCCQVVFCRNVLIYFSPEFSRSFLTRLADSLPAAVLFLGAAETIWSVTDRYTTVPIDETFYYRPTAAVPAPVRPIGPPAPSRSASEPLRTGGQATATARSPAPDRHVVADPRPVVTSVRKSVAAVTLTNGSAGDVLEAAALGLVGERALHAGDHSSAVIAFRKCAYLTPDDAVAHLHLGLALEAGGDVVSARRAFGTARRAVLATNSAPDLDALGGYAATELLKLLDIKRQDLGP